ncbi:hypothetical protein F9Z43_03370 [Pseudomonas monteilii]|uniref:Uncharacterized protein n=1 Tax=Pseudomonas monteilii TaxID=76759 RepID=A0A7X3EZQ0_9PSED|nr:hypothetical protein [Pseudomonas monteilii]
MLWVNCLLQILEACAVPVGAGLPANTGEARAIHRGACFAGLPALTGICVILAGYSCVSSSTRSTSL